MKGPGVILVLLALVIGVVPLFSDCQSQGSAIVLDNGATVPMKCHWTGRAELVVAGPLLFVGGLMVATRRRHVLRVLSALCAVLGICATLLPTVVIGVCANPDMICNLVMKPTLVLAGLLAAATGLAGLVYLRDDTVKLARVEG